MNQLAFINYRRSELALEGAVIHFLLQQRFGDQVFVDVDGVNAGENWPAVLESYLERATVLFALIGPRWLTAQDPDSGVRRLDMAQDWVRAEIERALARKITIVPVLVGGATIPPAMALPASIRELSSKEAISISDPMNIRPLVTNLKERGFIDLEQELDFPTPVRTGAKVLNDDEMRDGLAKLPLWSIVTRPLERAAHGHSIELMRVFKFETFLDVIHFMNTASRFIDRDQHHPFWENQYLDLRVRISSWDVKNRITALDIRLARKLENLYTVYVPEKG